MQNFRLMDKMLCKLSSGPFQKHIFDHVISVIGENIIAAYSENFPGLLHTPAKYEKNPPYGCEAIAKRKCGSGGVASPIYKQASLARRLIKIWLAKGLGIIST